MLAVVLNDGTTYTDIDGCKVVQVPDWVFDDDIEAFIRDHGDEGLAINDILAVYLVAQQNTPDIGC